MHHIGDLSNVLNGGALGLVLSAVSRKGTEESSFLRDGLFGAKTAGVPFRPHFVFGSDGEVHGVFGGLHKAT